MDDCLLDLQCKRVRARSIEVVHSIAELVIRYMNDLTNAGIPRAEALSLAADLQQSIVHLALTPHNLLDATNGRKSKEEEANYDKQAIQHHFDHAPDITKSSEC